MNNLEYILMIGVALSGKTTYRKGNFEHELIALSMLGNTWKIELDLILRLFYTQNICRNILF